MKCVYHAIKLFVAKGGYIWVRRSKFHKWLPHFGWAKSVTGSKHWQPDKPKAGWRILFDMWFAKGKVRKGK